MTRFLIPEQRIEDLEAKIAKLNRKSNLTGSETATFTIGAKIVRYYDKNGGECDVKAAVSTKTFFPVEVEGIAPKFDGWCFVGTLDYTENGNIFRSVPDKEIPEIFRNVKPKCDHCKSKRSRKNTFILKHEGGTYMQVGRQCLRDFLGHQSPEQIAWRFQWLLDLRTWSEESHSNGWSYPPVEYVVALTNAIVAKYGWISKQTVTNAIENDKNFIPTATTSRVWDHLTLTEKQWKEAKEEPVPVTQADIENAIVICDWINSQQDTTEPFIRNLWLAFQEKGVKRSNVGLVAAAWKAHNRATATQVVYEKKTDESKYVGEVGVRGHFSNLKVTKISEIEHDNNRFSSVTTLIRFEDETGNCLVWFGSGWHTEFECDQIYSVKATVKKHDEYKGKKQTIISRVKIVMEPQKQNKVSCQ